MTIIRACGANPTRRNTTCRPLPTQPPPTTAPPPLPAALVFDACNVGVVLRAVLFVQAVVATASMFGADSPLQWLQGMALLTGACLPGTLVWLVAACLLKHPLQRLPASGQYAAGVLLGMAAGLYACAMLHLAGGTSAPWLASAVSGGLLAALLVAALVLRARGHAPADTQARLAELQSRIRPHFLFNTLNSAIALVRAEPAKAEALLEDLSDLFRYALAEPHSTTTLAEEIELAQRYLAIEQVRFGERLQVRWQLDPAAHGALLPPLLLQPLVENAIKYAIAHAINGGSITVAATVEDERLCLQVADDGPGLDLDSKKSDGNGVGLSNCRERLKEIYGQRQSFELTTTDPHGLTIKICIPLEFGNRAS